MIRVTVDLNIHKIISPWTAATAPQAPRYTIGRPDSSLLVIAISAAAATAVVAMKLIPGRIPAIIFGTVVLSIRLDE